MFKMKLQEVCHRKKWGLPMYSCIKDGPNHNPQFRGSVSVNGISFNSPTISKSSKDALNEAAKLAFLHFTSDGKPIAEKTEIEEAHVNWQIDSNASNVKVGIQYQYKMLLQSFAQRKNLDSPLYCSKREGPPHTPQFQATVTIDGHSFESPGYFGTLREAEHAAAKVALVSFSLDAFQEIDSRFYKNLLQELTQKEGFTIPEYKTAKCGPPHQPTFFSSVEVEGEIFHGKGGKSKNLAELSAAKVAYTVFMKRKSTRCGDGTSGVSSAAEIPKCSSSSDLLTKVDPQQSLKPIFAVGSSSAKDYEQQATENEEELVYTEDLSVDAKVKSLQDNIAASQALPMMEETIGSGTHLCSSVESQPSSSKEGSAITTPPDLSTLSITASNIRTTAEMESSYLLCNRFRVYTCIQDISLPKGTILLPVDDCKWVAVSLEFPNEKIK